MKEVMEIIDEKTIKLNRELSQLDELVIDFVNILDSIDYVIVSGYVAILFGRSRGTEDVDIIVEPLSREKFEKLCKKSEAKGFWMLNSSSKDELYSMLKDGLAIRFAKKDEVVPNIELKFAKMNIDRYSLKNKIRVATTAGEVFISEIALQIAYKKYILKSKKDLEDALHLQKLFEISEEKIKSYEKMMDE